MTAELELHLSLYSALAACFADPGAASETAAVLRELEVGLSAAPARLAERWPADLARDLERAIEVLPSAGLTVPEEFTYLFHRQAACSPYESSYTSAGIEQGLADIAGFYRAFGVQVSPQAHERVDHIGTELEFMAVLCAKQAHATANAQPEQARICREARLAFLRDHLGLWAAPFSQRLQTVTRLPLFVALADILAALIEAEAQHLGVVLHRETGSLVSAALLEPGDMTCE